MDAPPPIFALLKTNWTNSDGDVVSSDIKLQAVAMPSYVNSLLLNGKAFIPRYLQLGSHELNENAAKIYREQGFVPISLNNDVGILSGGSIHCLTMDLH